MKTLKVGQFARYDQGETAVHAFQQAGFSADEMSLFYINPQGNTISIHSAATRMNLQVRMMPVPARLPVQRAALGLAATEVAARQPGVMLAVAVATAEQRADAETIMGRYTFQTQQSQGDLRNGDWIDFDPLATPEQTR